jgi:uncharacterized protein (DUF1800 family)
VIWHIVHFKRNREYAGLKLCHTSKSDERQPRTARIFSQPVETTGQLSTSTWGNMLQPLPDAQWDYARAAHLLNRAGFGGPPRDIERLVSVGPTRAVRQLVDYDSIPDPQRNPAWAKPDPTRSERFREMRDASEEERRKLRQMEQRTQRRRFAELQGWWLQRMITTSRPLQEKMTLFWHGHFATSFVKVRDAYLMWLQNDLFRSHATGNWLELLVAIARDPAMLLWLDQAQSRKQHPNENFARELMELFTLGEGYYTETDVSEAARAFTGWSYDRQRQEFVWRPYQHDRGSKTVLGLTGQLDGNDVIAAIAEQPRTARFITGRLWTYFAGSPPSDELNAALATVFEDSGGDFKPLLLTLFRSEAFYAPEILGNQVKSPTQWLVGSIRMLDRKPPPPFVMAALTKNLGQELFAPPNVKGWDGGVTWITTNSLLARYNQAALLVYGGRDLARNLDAKDQAMMDRRLLAQLTRAETAGVAIEEILSASERADREQLIAALERRLLVAPLSAPQEAALRGFLESRGTLDEDDILGAIRLVMSTPEFQLT